MRKLSKEEKKLLQRMGKGVDLNALKSIWIQNKPMKKIFIRSIGTTVVGLIECLFVSIYWYLGTDKMVAKVAASSSTTEQHMSTIAGILAFACILQSVFWGLKMVFPPSKSTLDAQSCREVYLPKWMLIINIAIDILILVVAFHGKFIHLGLCIIVKSAAENYYRTTKKKETKEGIKTLLQKEKLKAFQ